LYPYPTEITQAEKQYVKYIGNAVFYSPYITEVQETSVIVTKPINILSYTKEPSPVKKSDNVITYGPYKSHQPYSIIEMMIHYENNRPFLTVTQLTRTIELSHWGNIAVEEVVDMYHSGAKLKGPFSRFEYQRNQGGASSIKSFKTVLPASARDVYYRDEIGNISTSNLREMPDSVELDIRPRFPLFGGWKTHYTIGYNVPSYEYLYHKGNRYGLKMRFVDHIHDDQVVDQMTIKIVMPETVSDIKMLPPYPAIDGGRQNKKTYLDTTGREVIVLHKNNLVENHIQDFELYYTFNKVMLIREPIMVIVAFLLLFSVVIAYVRVDFSITKDKASESKMRVEGLIEEIRATQDRRSALYQAYEDVLKKFKSNKDVSVLNSGKKKIDADHKTLSAKMSSQLAKLRGDANESADKVVEVNNLDTNYREQVNQQYLLAERFVGGKISKPAYIEADQRISQKLNEYSNRIEVILNGM
jgi:oligosaccharyltransferase complex subunit alpha (ribophorin I)